LLDKNEHQTIQPTERRGNPKSEQKRGHTIFDTEVRETEEKGNI